MKIFSQLSPLFGNPLKLLPAYPPRYRLSPEKDLWLQAVWPDLAKFRQFSTNLEIFVNISKVYLIFGKVWAPTFGRFVCFWAKIHPCKWPNIEKQSGHLVTLVTRKRHQHQGNKFPNANFRTTFLPTNATTHHLDRKSIIFKDKKVCVAFKVMLSKEGLKS